MRQILQDIRIGLRMLARDPGFTLIAVLTLALGIGANTAIFGMINSVLIKSLPYPNSNQIVEIFESPPGFDRNAVSGGAFKDWQALSAQFSNLAIFEGANWNLTGIGSPERVSGLMVSSEFLPVLGVQPIAGRGFAAGEDKTNGNNHVAMLSFAFWQSRFGGDAGVVGKTISLDQIPFTVVGVLPAGALMQDAAQILTPEVIDGAGTNWERSGHFREAIGRLKPGVTPSQAQAELRNIRQRLASQYPTFKKDWTVSVFSLQEVYAGLARPMLLVLLATVSLVLLIACANVANLLLARGNGRSREMAIRAALGASAWSIVRQLLVESGILALLGCGLGLLLAAIGIRLVASLLAGVLPQPLHPELDLNVLLFSITTACGCGLLFGIFPALRASKLDLNHDLKDSERGSTSVAKSRSQSILIVSEFAFTLILLIGAGLFLRSFVRLIDKNLGFNPRQTLAFDLSLPTAKYPKGEDRLRLVDAINTKLAALPGVEFVGSASALPLSAGGSTEMASRNDRPPTSNYVVAITTVNGDYFSAMGIKLLRGRLLTNADHKAGPARTALIDTGVVHDLYPDEDPIGRIITVSGMSCEIVGVVEPIRQFSVDRDPRPTIYAAQSTAPLSAGFVLRSALPVEGLTEQIRTAIHSVDPDQPIADVRTLEQALHKSIGIQTASLILLGLFAALAVSLACIGIYGVMSHVIGQRARELCIRSALGATRRDIIRLVLAGGAGPSIVGIVVGGVIAFALSRLIAALLFEVQAHDPLVFISSIAVLAMLATLSVLIPAIRAANLDPMKALRHE